MRQRSTRMGDERLYARVGSEWDAEHAADTAARNHGRAEMIDLYNASTGQLIGSITEAELQVLRDALEEESSQDQDYYINPATIDVLADGRATTHLVGLLRTALGTSDGVDIRWQRR
jgi:hypothetical protein